MRCLSTLTVVVMSLVLAPASTHAGPTQTLSVTSNSSNSANDIPPDHGDTTHGEGNEDSKEYTFDHFYSQKQTNFVRFTVYKANIQCEGMVEDAKPGAASAVEGEAWGCQAINLKLDGPEGWEGKILCRNDIAFYAQYDIDVSLQGSITALATAVDQKGGAHHFKLAVNSSGNVSTTTSGSFTVGVTGDAELESSLGVQAGGTPEEAKTASNKKGVVSASVASSKSVQFNIALAIQKSSTTNTGPGDAGALSNSFTINDEEEGQLPIEWDRSVSSSESVTLKAWTHQEDVTVKTYLKRFDVENGLKATHEILRVPNDVYPGGGDPPYDTWITLSIGPERDGACSLSAYPEVGAVARASAGIGLADEPSASVGHCFLLFDRPAPADVTFGLSVDPASAVDTHGVSAVTVSAGQLAATVPFMGLEATEATFSFVELDGAGQPTSNVFTATATSASTATLAEPIVWAGLGADCWSGPRRSFRFVAGQAVPPLKIMRSNFDGFASTSTTVSISVTDPEDILGEIPSSALIGAGQDSMLQPLALTSNSGTATVEIACGSSAFTVSITAVAQSWSMIPNVRLPVGATTHLTAILDQQAHVNVPITATLSHSSYAALGGTTTQVYANRWCTEPVEVTGLSSGITTLVLATPGLPDLSVPIAVVPRDVEIVAGRLHVRGIDGTLAATIEVEVAEGATITSLAAPAGSEVYLDVAGLGTREIKLTFTPSPSTPTELAMDIAIAGASASYAVVDRMRETLPVRYTLPID